MTSPCARRAARLALFTAALVVTACGAGDPEQGSGGASSASATATASASASTSASASASAPESSAASTSASGGGGAASSSASASSSSSGTPCTPTGPETCATTADEDCDGTECGVAGKVYGDASGSQSVDATTFTPAGDLYFSGSFDGATITFAGASYTGQSGQLGSDTYLAKVTADGQEAWLKPLPGFLLDMSGNGDGGVTLLTQLNLDFGVGDLSSNDPHGWGLVTFDADGTPRWAKRFLGDAWAPSFASTADGRLVLLFVSDGAIAYEDTPLADVAGALLEVDVDLVTGDLLAFHELSTDADSYTEIGPPAFDAEGGVVFQVDYADAISFGSFAFPQNITGADAALVHVDATGAVSQATRYCLGGDGCWAGYTTVGPNDEVYATFLGEAATVGGTFYGLMSGYVARFNADDSVAWVHTWTSSETSTYGVEATPITLDANGTLGFGTTISGAAHFDWASFPTKGDRDVVVTKLHPDGTLDWFRDFGAPGGFLQDYAATPYGQAPDGGGLVIVSAFNFAGQPNPAYDFGSGALQPPGNTDVLLERLAP